MNYSNSTMVLFRHLKTNLSAVLALASALVLTSCWQEKTEEVTGIDMQENSGYQSKENFEKIKDDTDPDTGKYFVKPKKMLSYQFGKNFEKAGTVTTEEQAKMSKMSNGILYRDIEVGFGLSPMRDAQALVHYIAYNPDGTEFDSSVYRGNPIDFMLGGRNVMAGLQGGILGMKVGGVRKVIIPAHLCVGPLGRKQMNGNREMTMILRLLSVGQNYASSPPPQEESPYHYFKKEYEKQGIDTSNMPW